MAEYLVQDTSLTAVADAIRAKTGSADLLAFPSGMVDAIAGIASGGSGLKHASGTWTPASDTYFMKVTGLPFTPKMFKIIVTADGRMDGTAKSHGTIYVDGDCCWLGSNASGTTLAVTCYLDLDTTAESDDITTIPNGSKYHGLLQTGFYSYGSNKTWVAGYTYEWEAWGE